MLLFFKGGGDGGGVGDVRFPVRETIIGYKTFAVLVGGEGF